MLNFYTYISLQDFTALCGVNKHLYKTYHNDENIWKYYSKQKFSDEFWIRAQQHPHFGWKFGLNNILDFEHKVKILESPLWHEKEYFIFWTASGW